MLLKMEAINCESLTEVHLSVSKTPPTIALEECVNLKDDLQQASALCVEQVRLMRYIMSFIELTYYHM